MSQSSYSYFQFKKLPLVENSFDLKNEGNKEDVVELKGTCNTKILQKKEGLISSFILFYFMHILFSINSSNFHFSLELPKRTSLLLLIIRVFVCQSESCMSPSCLRFKNVQLGHC